MPRRNSRATVEPATDNVEIILKLRKSIVAGKPWHRALLEAISLWTSPYERYSNNSYYYLIDTEAFDWLLLAERLCKEIMDIVPEDEVLDLLFYGRFPEELTEEEFKVLIGNAKYHAYLNFLYGITIEKFVVIAVEEEILKEQQAHVFSGNDDGRWDSYQRVYGASWKELFNQFREEKGFPNSERISIGRIQDFTYWLFKYRIANCDKERVASDTKKGIEYLRRQRTVQDSRSVKRAHRRHNPVL